MRATFGGSGPPPGSAWARLELVRGESTGRHWSIDARTPQIRVSVGSAPDAGWSVQWPGVHSHHFELFWDGQALWIADLRGVGGVALNGTRVLDWVQVAGKGELTFGGASMRIETSAPPTHDMASEPGEAALVMLSPTDPAMQSGNLVARSDVPTKLEPLPSWDDSSLMGEATRIAPPPLMNGGANPWSEHDSERTRVAPLTGPAPPPTLGAAASRPSQPAPAAPLAMRPRLGGSSGSAPPPAGPSASAPMIPAAAPVLDAPVPSAPGPAAAPFPVEEGSGFRPPPDFESTKAKKVTKGKQSLPTRTWVLLIVTVLAGAGVLMMEPRTEPEAPPAPAATTPGPAVVPAPLEPGTGAPEPGAAPTPPVDPQLAAPLPPPDPSGAVEAPSAPTPPLPPPPELAEDEPEPADEPEQLGDEPEPSDEVAALLPGALTPEREAADLVIAGRFDDALPRYRALAEAHPERPEFAFAAEILERRVATRCRDGVGPDGRPCRP